MFFRKRLYAGRAAVCTENTQEAIRTAVVTAYEQFLKKNNLHEQDIVSIQFSLTTDLTAANPATLLRSAGYASVTALFCSAEPEIKDAPKGIIRLLIYYYGREKATPVYLGGAERLRPDLFTDMHKDNYFDKLQRKQCISMDG